MNTSQKEQFRTLLLQQREQVVASLNNDEDPAENQDLRDPEEMATLITRSEVDDQLAEDDLNLVQKIDFALQRLDQDRYDQCDRCGTTIPLDRLLAKPSVSLCVACQEKKDAARL